MSADDFSKVLELDVDKDGSWSQDESLQFISATIRRGRETALQPMAPGVMTVVMQNSDGRFSPDKGIISGLDTFIPIRLYSTWTEVAITNLVENPSVEIDTVGWADIGAAAGGRITSEAWVGAASFVSVVTDAATDGVGLNKRSGSRIDVTAALVYTWSVRVKANAVKNLLVRIRWFNSGGSVISTSSTVLATSLDWQQTSIAATAPAGAVTAIPDIVTLTAQGVFTFFADAAFFYQAGSPTAELLPYVDGDQPGCTWSGTAHESTSSRPANPSFLQFQGFIFDIDLQEDHLDRTATLICMDRLALLAQTKISIGNILSQKSALSLHRCFDRVEGELITNWGVEWTELTGNPTTGYSLVGAGVTLGVNRIINSGIDPLIFEGDWSLEIRPNGAVNDGIRYDATTDIAATGDYRIVWYAKAKTSDVSVKFRFLRDAVVEETQTFTLTSTWQRFVIDVSFSTLGTNRYIEMVNAGATSLDFLVDDLHAVKKMNAINRDFDLGEATILNFNAYEEPAGSVISDLIESEPGILFVKAKTLALGDELAYRGENSRDLVATQIPRVVLGDGDGLLFFAEGLKLTHRAIDRIRRVEITSRGKLVLGSASTTLWGMSPRRTTTTGEEFQARYEATGRGVIVATKGGGAVADENVNYGAGADVEVTTGAADMVIFYEGFPYNRSTERSSVIKLADIGLPMAGELTVRMPLQGTNTTEMTNEAQRLIDKYKNRVIRCRLPLDQADDVMHSWLLDLDLDDEIIVRAEEQAHSPGFDKRFFVEGIEHMIEESIHTTLILEER